MRKPTCVHFSLLLIVMLCLTSTAFAAGPLENCRSGRPYLWPNGGQNIPFNPDQGDLGPLTNAEAVAATADAFQAWTDVASSTASYTNAGLLPVDVNIDNFADFLFPTAPDGLSAIVFDDTGEIFDLLFGANSGILGFAGPEWLDDSKCRVLEGVSFLNGPTFDDAVVAKDIMVHEFGHYSNLAHTAVNGQLLLGDFSGPTPFDTFPIPSLVNLIETMYPFYAGPLAGTRTPDRDDIASISTLYPAAGFASSTGSIAGRVLRPNGKRISGVNVIARNIANPFGDAVSAMSGDFTDGTSPSDPVVGTYRLNGLTPGAQYAVFVDEILDGGFSTPPLTPLPGVEEFYNGAAESNDVTSPDPPDVFAPVNTIAGRPTTGINITFNTFAPGEALPTGDDGLVWLDLPFEFKMCGQTFDFLFVNGNGSITFGAPSGDFTESVADLSNGPPRLAGLWDDLNPSRGGVVSFNKTSREFEVSWTNVPEFLATGSNTFAITLFKNSNDDDDDDDEDSGSRFKLTYGALSAIDGLAGYSCGGRISSGFENESDLSALAGRRIETGATAVYEIFGNDNDLDNQELSFVTPGRFRDRFGSNNSLARATRVSLPFDTADRFSDISPEGNDVDYYRFSVKAGDILAVETVRGILDSAIGVFDVDTGQLLAVNDDGGAGLLSRLLLQANADLNLAVAVSTFPDLDFTGAGGDSGRYVLSIRKYRGTVLPADDDTSTPVNFTGFTFPYQGTNWSSVFVNSNGNLTFGASNTDFSESVPEFLGGPPRIAPLWDDLDAFFGLVIAEPKSNALAVHYVSVPEFFSDAPNYFTVHMDSSGAFLIDYGANNRSDALAGITQGGGAADPGETNLSRLLPVFRKSGTIYEQFIAPDPNDFSWRTFFFLLP